MCRSVAIAVALFALIGNGAFACDVGDGTLTPPNFSKLIVCVNALEATTAKLNTTIVNLQNDISNLTKGMADVHKNLDDLNTAMARVQNVVSAIDGAAVTVRATVPNAGPWIGSGTGDLHRPDVQCPPNTWLSGIQGFKANINDLPAAVQGLTELQYTCRGTHGTLH
jgi:exonuclease VII small subunit